ncbi:MAG: tRNA 4-thiouridine(8) synthase ThiI [Candidatus Omnitrophota bacterium]|nr:MAG: tRNA 4-thiouridine(8) synthase ThiI [Candidatus Omnitrophota bacterium]
MKAVALISGGLDSILSAILIRSQGIKVIGLYFKTPFASQRENLEKIFLKQKLALLKAGIKINSVVLGKEYLKIISKPRYGYGANLNPCIDCRILMLNKARLMMHRLGAKFIITGEVLGQRPMSQHKQALELIEKEARLSGLILRPLSARAMPESLPEREGWVKRNNLFAIQGRSRRTQIALAEKFNIKYFFTPAGGCLLTDRTFTQRLNDLLQHGEFNLHNIALLKIGRHFRLAPKTKLIVGRNEEENKKLLKLAFANDYLFTPYFNISGPTALLRGNLKEELIDLANSIVCRYCDRNGKSAIRIIYKKVKEKKRKSQETSPIEENKMSIFRV